MAEQSNRAKALFLAAIDRHAPEQWPAFLDRECGGDVPLRVPSQVGRIDMEIGQFEANCLHGDRSRKFAEKSINQIDPLSFGAGGGMGE